MTPEDRPRTLRAPLASPPPHPHTTPSQTHPDHFSTQSKGFLRVTSADLNTIRSVLSESAAAKGLHRLLIAVGDPVCAVLFHAFMLLAVPIVILRFCIAIFNVREKDDLIAVILIGVGVLVVMAVPFLLAGWGQLSSKNWRPLAAVTASVPNIFDLPLGAALAVCPFRAVATGKLNADSFTVAAAPL